MYMYMDFGVDSWNVCEFYIRVDNEWTTFAKFTIIRYYSCAKHFNEWDQFSRHVQDRIYAHRGGIKMQGPVVIQRYLHCHQIKYANNSRTSCHNVYVANSLAASLLIFMSLTLDS